MNESNDEKISEEEEFANTYYYFLEALNVLAGNVDTQCKTMGNFNVAWELKDDVSRGSYLLNMPKEKLSAEERNGITELLRSLSGIPDSVLIAANTEDANRKAMNNPCWVPLRKEAKKLLQTLRHRKE